MTRAALHSGDVFAANHPDIEVTRYFIPSFESSPNVPASDLHRQLEGQQIREMLPVLIARARPDILIIGREAFAWYVPALAALHALPCLLMVHGAAVLADPLSSDEGVGNTRPRLCRRVPRLESTFASLALP
jgi:hypothetical protein